MRVVVALGGNALLRRGEPLTTTMTFLGIVACQVGTLFAARTERESLRTVGVFSNRLVLLGIAFELVFCALLLFVPPLQDLFGTALPPTSDLCVLLAFPLIVWGADELRRRARRTSSFNATGSS